MTCESGAVPSVAGRAPIQTPDGRGTVVDIKHYNRIEGGMNRYGVILDSNPYSYSPVYYFADEVTHVNG